MTHTTGAGPESDSSDLEQFRIHSRVEIIALMRALQDAHTLVAVYWDGGSRSIVTNVLAVDPEFEEIVLDAAAKDEDNASLLRSTPVTAVALLDQVKIQFQASRASQTVFEDAPALRVRLPDSLLRLQRRNFYRVATPVAKPLKVVVPPAGERAKSMELRVFDLSCGGVGVLQPGSAPPCERGTVLANCRIDLPEVGSITSAMVLRFAAAETGANGSPQVRCGFEFVDLPSSMMTAIQRYINKLERERRARA